MQPLLIAYADGDATPNFRETSHRRPRLRAPTDLLRLATIRTRLFATFSLMCVLMGMLGAAAWWATATENRAFNLFVNGAVASLRAGGDLRTAFVDTRAREKEVLLASGQPERRDSALRAWREQVALVKDGMVRLQPQVRDPRAAARLKEIQASFGAYAARMDAAFALSEAKGPADAQALEAAIDEAGADYRRAETAMEEAFALFDGVLADVVQRINGLAATLVTVMVAALAAAVALAALAGWSIARSIHRPLREAEHFAARLQGGDLTATLDVGGRDEITALCRALAAMQTGLRTIVTQARQAAATVATSSSQIAAGSADLSQRTDEQAANLEETAASLEELTATVQQNAHTAQRVRQASLQAAEAAARGTDVVAKVVGTMGSIGESSRRITDIIELIDNVAFRTNILALNAAVESARAGEHGRGFAVVAGEVRSLAQRSAEAAREIRALIADSVRTVETGGLLAAQAGQAIEGLRQQVQQVSELIAQITAASVEQGTGIGQVSDALAQLDRVTQQNAALVEESAAAAVSLKMHAHQMAQTVAVFKLE